MLHCIFEVVTDVATLDIPRLVSDFDSFNEVEESVVQSLNRNVGDILLVADQETIHGVDIVSSVTLENFLLAPGCAFVYLVQPLLLVSLPFS